MVEVKASGQPHVIRFVVVVGVLPVNLASTSPFLVSVKFHGHHKTVTKLPEICQPSVFGIMPDLYYWLIYCHDLL